METQFSTGCPTDSSEEMLLGFIPTYESGRALLPIRPVKGCGDQYWAFGADQQLQKIIWIEEGSFRIVSVVLDPTRTGHSVFAEPNGQWTTAGSAPFFDSSFELSESVGRNVYGTFTASSEFLDAYGDLDQLSAWSMIGLERYSTLRPDGLRRTEAQCDVTITNVTTTRTVTVSLNGLTLCIGSLIGDGMITLTEQNESGVSGTVAITYSADVISGCTLTKRYAFSYSVDLSLTVPPILHQGTNAPILKQGSNAPIFKV